MLLWCLLAIGGVGCAAPCQDGTVFVQLTLSGQAMAADSIGVALTVADQMPEYRMVGRSSSMRSSESLTLAFPGGYPVGRQLMLTVVALRNATILAVATDFFTAQPTCSTRALTLTAGGTGGPDGGVPDGGGGDGDAGTPSIAFRQLAISENDLPTSSAGARFNNAQAMGDVNLVVIGVGDTGTPISSVTDLAGNSYSPVVGPTITSGALQAIYAATNIHSAPGNTVTVTFAQPVRYLTVIGVEYSGVSRLDGTAMNSGSTGGAFSGAAPASRAPELVFAAGLPDNLGNSNFIAGDPAFTVRLITPGAGMLIEDRLAESAGTYGATGALSMPASWVMQAVTLQ